MCDVLGQDRGQKLPLSVPAHLTDGCPLPIRSNELPIGFGQSVNAHHHVRHTAVHRPLPDSAVRASNTAGSPADVAPSCLHALLFTPHTLVTEALSTACAVVAAVAATGTVALAGHC